MGTSTIKFITI